MSTQTVAQQSFVGGEWSPSLYGRSDIAKYQTAVRLMRNFIAHPQGGVSNRPGTYFVGEAKNPSGNIRLVPFQFSVVQGYALEFGHNYMRVVKDGGYVLDGSNNIYELVTTYADADIPLLKFTQSADVLYVTHPSYAPRKITRTGHASWSISTVSFTASISAPTNLATTVAGADWQVVITAVNDDGQESLSSTPKDTSKNSPTITWTAVSGAEYYNVYVSIYGSGVYGFMARASTTTHKFLSDTILPDFSKTPPKARNPFGSSNNYPGCSTFFEQRLIFARTNNQPQTFWGSVTADFENQNISIPLKADDAYEFTINSRQVNEIRWLLPLTNLLIGTSGGEWVATGGNEGITPANVNVKPQSSWGVSNIPPIVVGDTAVFIDASENSIRDLLYSLERDGYTGNDLTILANHLFKNYKIKGWAYQRNPDSIIWCVRDDGALLGLTYYREQEIWGWHRHDTNGKFIDVCSIQTSEGKNEVYFIVERTLPSGQIYRYVEQLADRLPYNTDYTLTPDNAFFVDSGLTYDGWNSVSDDYLKVTGASYGVGDTLTMTATGHTPFSNASVGRYYKLQYGTDSVTVRVTAYSSSTSVDVVVVNRPVPSALQNFDTARWARMVTSLSGLSHLEGFGVSVLADGNVVSNKTVTSGAITLPNAAAKVHVGLGFTSQIETLDYDYQTRTGSLQDKQREVKSALIRLENTRALWVGSASDRLYEVPFRENEDYGEPTALFTGDKEAYIEADGGVKGRVWLESRDPLPVTIITLWARIEHGED